MQLKINIFFFILLLIGCDKSTEPENSPKGTISGNVFNNISLKQPSQSISITLRKFNATQTALDSITSVFTNSLHQYTFSGLDTGGYYVESNNDLYVKTGYSMYCKLTIDSLNHRLDVPFDTVKTRP